MSRTNLTILDPIAYAEHLEQQNLDAINELDGLLNTHSPLPLSQSPASLSIRLPIMAAFSAGLSLGIFAGVALSGGLS